ncbi:MAG: molybdopterin molybdotransferase MoeA, partial [Acidimicrobiales bacterium]
EEARSYVLERVPGALDAVDVPVPDAVGLVAAADVTAAELQPPFANSAMDGFAVRSADTESAPVTLQVVATTLAGERAADAPVGEAEAVRIMTGAPVPAGVDAVIPIERVEVLDDGAAVRVNEPVKAGAHVRPAGDDVRPGDVVLPAGVVVTPAHVGVLTGLGIGRVAVRRRPRVGVLSTGDELVDGPEPLLSGQIRDSNRPALLAAVAAAGAEPVDLGIAPDNTDGLTRALMRGVSGCDAIVTSGGVSMGDVDLVRVVLDVIGEMRWMQIAIKPAKPFAFGLVDGTPVFGLPGNPVSSLVSYELFARPAIRRLAGHPDDRLDRPCPVAVAPDGLSRHPDGKLHFVRVAVRVTPDGGFEARSAGAQGSHQLSAMAGANGLAVVPDGDGVAPGGTVDVLLVGDL